MEIRNCKRCSRIFNYNGSGVCPNCFLQEQEDFEKVRDFLFVNPNSSTIEVSQGTGVDVKIISRFLKEGRLKGETEGMGDSTLTCDKCGCDIQSGRFCEKCIVEMQSDFKKAVKPANPNMNNNANNPWKGGKVHTYDHILRKKD